MRQAFAWTGAALFALSLLSFVIAYSWRFGFVRPGGWDAAAWRDVLDNFVLFTVFALHHSVMARTGAKAWITKLVPAELERSVYVWIASVLFLAVCWWWQPLPGTSWDVPPPYSYALYALQAIGIGLTLQSARIVGIWDLAGVKAPAPQAAVEFKAIGPYGIVRHPIYLGWVLIVFATPAMTSTRLLFAAVSTIYLAVAIPLEERSLVAAFGHKYRRYQQQTPWKLLPGVW